MAKIEKPLNPTDLLEQASKLIGLEAKGMTSTVLLSHAYIIAASICQHLVDLETAVDRSRGKTPGDKPTAHYRRDEGSRGEGSRA